MNEQAPEGQTSAPGRLSPPPWPSFGARPPDSVAADTYLSDLDAADADMRDSGGRDSADDDGPITRDSAQDSGPITRDSAQDDDPDSEDADSDLGYPDVVILPDSATTRAHASPDAAPPIDASHLGADPGDLVILPDSATTGRHAAPDDAVAPASAMLRPPTDPYAVHAPASAAVPPADADIASAPVSATSSSVKEQTPDRIAATAATSPAGLNVTADLEPGRVAGNQAAGSFELGARHEQWRSIQSAFVDDPRRSVAAAAHLAAEVVAELVASAQERERALRGEWDRDGADTEDLRNALRHYRSFLERLPAL